MSKPFHVIATPDENGYMVTIPENPNVSARCRMHGQCRMPQPTRPVRQSVILPCQQTAGRCTGML